MNRRDLLKLSAVLAAAPASAQVSWKPAVLDPHQYETVMALTDLIIPATDTPGAKAAQVHRFIDMLLAHGEPSRKQSFLEGLSWLDGFALRQHNQPFLRCSQQQQTALLKTLEGTRDVDLAPGARFFQQAKRMTSRIYYATEAGFQELNKGGRVPASFGCKHPSHL